MILLISFLTVVLVLDCLLLILLVLVQLPKKEAGAGIAFGGSAADALFGAGTGNVLTKTTKYATVAFFILLLVIGLMQKSYYSNSSKSFSESANAAAQHAPASTAPESPAAVPLTTAPASNPPVLNAPTNIVLPAVPSTSTSAPVAPK